MSTEDQDEKCCWLTSMQKGRGRKPPSPFGLTVGRICSVAFGGIHNMPRVYHVDWSNPRMIVAKVARNLATFDSCELTSLVVLCHDTAIRLEIDVSTYRDSSDDDNEVYRVACLKLIFTQRTREGDVFSRHPSMIQAIQSVRRNLSADFPRIEEKDLTDV